MNDVVDRLLYKECARVEFEKVGDNTISDFRNFVLADLSNTEIIELIDKFEKVRDKVNPG